MKKLFFATALLAVTLVGCNQDQEPNTNTDDSDNKTQQLTPAQQYNIYCRCRFAIMLSTKPDSASVKSI